MTSTIQQQQHQASQPPTAAVGTNVHVAPLGDDRSTSPTVVVTTNQLIKEGGDKHISPNPSTAPNSSANSTPMSTYGAAVGVYTVPNPVQSQHQIPEPPHPMEIGARASTPSLLHYQHSQHGSWDPLSSPQSAPPLTGWARSAAPPSSNNTPVPSEIHTGSGSVAGRGPVPFFPSIKNSASSNSICSKASTKSVQVTGKKKHLTKSSSSRNGSDEVMVTDENAGKGGKVVTVRKQKRLERNRESARLSRRRRKQYLEVLEERVSQLSLEVDKGRRDHASQAIPSIVAKRSQVLESAIEQLKQQARASFPNHLDQNLWLLEDGPLSRHSLTLLVLSTFYTQQLKSFSLPSQSKYVMWLTLQNDTYFRGGRAASERLSAARIGERMLSNGNDKVTPANSMWPLVCNEVGLSYDQEERVRQYQRAMILPDPNSWLDRHTARASSLAMESYHDAFGSMTTVLGQRERKTNQILTCEQRTKFLAWAGKNAERMKSRLQKRKQTWHQQEPYMMTDAETCSSVDARDDHDNDQESKKYQLDKSHHVAANLYILNHRLQNVLQGFPFRPPVIVTATSLKKLSRRPSFESLGQQRDFDGHGLSRDTSFASMSSLKQSASSVSLAGSVGEDMDKLTQANQLTPEDAEVAASSMVDEVLGFVKPVIPPFPPPRVAAVQVPYAHTIATPTLSAAYASASTSNMYQQPSAVPHYNAPPRTSAPLQHVEAHVQGSTPHQPGQQLIHYHHAPQAAATAPPSVQHHIYQQPQLVHYQHAPPALASVQPSPQTPSGYAPVPSPLDNLHPAAVPAPQDVDLPPSHSRKSSFLPPHLNVVPEDMFAANDTAAEDFFVGLMDDEDWAIGEGIDMDTTS